MCDIGQSNVHASLEDVSSLVKSIREGNGEMSIADWLSLVEDLANFRPKPLMLLTGTEPFLYPHVMRLIENIIENNFSLHITTNGTQLSSYARRLVELCHRPDAIDLTVSLDGIGESHDRIRGVPGTFQKAMNGIQDILQARREQAKDFPVINITCTISQENYRNLESFVAWFCKENIPVESFTFNHLWFKDERIVQHHNEQFGGIFPVDKENVTGIDFTCIDMAVVLDQIHNIKRTYRSTPFRIYQIPDLSYQEAMTYYEDPCRFVFYDKCTGPWRNVSITPKGNIINSPMCFFPSPGSVKEHRFSTLWNAKQFRAMRSHLKDSKAFPACSRCCMLFGSKPKYYKIKSWLQ
jgi:MoaA/NifB/PqqE/SkfB family radical SAM enzyme